MASMSSKGQEAQADNTLPPMLFLKPHEAVYEQISHMNLKPQIFLFLWQAD